MKIISVHTPKAGGTSVSVALASAFGAAFQMDNSDDPADPRSARNVDPQRYFSRNRELPEEVHCLHGHFHPGQFRLENVFLFTMLRHPVDNIISIYYFWKNLPSQGQPLHDYFLNNDLDIFEMASLPLLRYLYSETYFGGFDMSRFNLVGRHEDRDPALNQLSELAGISIDASLHVNTTAFNAEREELLADQRQMGKLRELLDADIRFYEEFRS